MAWRNAWMMSMVCVSLLGCDSKPGPPATSGSTNPSAQAVSDNRLAVSIQLNWKPEAEHGGYYAAMVHGYYAEEGLDVKLLPGGPGIPLMESVATNRVAFGVDNADKLIRARAEDADVVAVFAPIQDSPRCILVHEESGIKRLTDLGSAEGMTLAWNESQPFAQFLSTKLDLSRLQKTKYSGVGPFLLDKKSAMQAYSISEPFLARQQEAKPMVLMLSDMGFNTYTSLLLTNSQIIKEQPELIRKVIRASQRGWSKYLTDAKETNRHIAGLNPEMPEDVLAFGVTELQRLCQPDTAIGGMSKDRWQTLVQQLEEIPLIEPNAVPAAAAFTTEFLPETE